MPTDAPASTTSPGSRIPVPETVGAWTEARIDAALLWVVVGALAVAAAALGTCLWILAGREPLPLFVNPGR